MGGEPGTSIIGFAPSQELPEGYRVVLVSQDGGYWWEGPDSTFGGPFKDRFAARRAALIRDGGEATSFPSEN